MREEEEKTKERGMMEGWREGGEGGGGGGGGGGVMMEGCVGSNQSKPSLRILGRPSPPSFEKRGGRGKGAVKYRKCPTANPIIHMTPYMPHHHHHALLSH